MSEFEQELLRRTYSLIDRYGKPDRDYVGNPSVVMQISRLRLEKRLGLSDTASRSMVIYHMFRSPPRTQVIYQEGTDHFHVELLREALLTLRQHMVLEDLADV
jgi:hypothetical protein